MAAKRVFQDDGGGDQPIKRVVKDQDEAAMKAQAPYKRDVDSKGPPEHVTVITVVFESPDLSYMIVVRTSEITAEVRKAMMDYDVPDTSAFDTLVERYAPYSYGNGAIAHVRGRADAVLQRPAFKPNPRYEIVDECVLSYAWV